MSNESTSLYEENGLSLLQMILVYNALFICWMPMYIYGSIKEATYFNLLIPALFMTGTAVCLWSFPGYTFWIETGAWIVYYVIGFIIATIAMSAD